MGELLRRYLAAGLYVGRIARSAAKEKLLCEEVVVFRDKKGLVGALDPHRGTSLERGGIEENGIRSCYHGWLHVGARTVAHHGVSR